MMAILATPNWSPYPNQQNSVAPITSAMPFSWKVNLPMTVAFCFSAFRARSMFWISEGNKTFKATHPPASRSITSGKLNLVYCKIPRVCCPAVAFSSISTPSSTRPPPSTVIAPPMMHPQAIAKYMDFPKTELSRFKFKDCAISWMTGNRMTATACSDMKHELNAAKQ